MKPGWRAIVLFLIPAAVAAAIALAWNSRIVQEVDRFLADRNPVPVPAEEPSPSVGAAASIPAPTVIPKTTRVSKTRTRDIQVPDALHLNFSTPIQAPSRDMLKAEHDRYPEETPASLVRFARDLAPKISAARMNEKGAQEFVGVLSDCALSEGATTVRAYCFSVVRDLARVHESLRPRYEELQARLPKDVGSRLDKLGL